MFQIVLTQQELDDNVANITNDIRPQVNTFFSTFQSTVKQGYSEHGYLGNKESNHSLSIMR